MSTSIPVSVLVVKSSPRSVPSQSVSCSAGRVGRSGVLPGALIREGTKPCSLGPGKGSGRASSGAHVVLTRPGASPARGDPCGALSMAGDSLLPAAAAAAASGGVCCSIPRFGSVPGSPSRWDGSAQLSRGDFMPHQLSERVPPSERTRVSSSHFPTWISASCTLHPETQHSFLPGINWECLELGWAGGWSQACPGSGERCQSEPFGSPLPPEMSPQLRDGL